MVSHMAITTQVPGPQKAIFRRLVQATEGVEALWYLLEQSSSPPARFFRMLQYLKTAEAAEAY